MNIFPKYLLNVKKQMKKYVLFVLLFLHFGSAFSQNVGMVRTNYISTVYDSTLMIEIEVFDSGTIRLGTIDPLTGIVLNSGTAAYNMGINLSGATINPYSNEYYIGSGFNLLTFDIDEGELVNNVPITGELPSSAFQNIRFNPSDSLIYGMVPNNFYSSYYDSTLMETIEVYDSTQIRFGSLNPMTGEYSLIGSASLGNIYTLAGNSIDPYQMVYYYSSVSKLVGIDLYTGEIFSEAPFIMPETAIFDHITYSCADTSIYGIVRQNYISTVYDSLLMGDFEVVDSTTFRLSKVDPNTGEVTFISPINIEAGGNLTGGSFIDPASMTFYFSHAGDIVGVSLETGLITSSVPRTFEADAFTLDMMRSTENCWGAEKMRPNTVLVKEAMNEEFRVDLFPNPAQNEINLQLSTELDRVELLDLNGKVILTTQESPIDILSLPSGIYIVKIIAKTGEMAVKKVVKS